MKDMIESKIEDIDGTMFLHNQNIERCLVVKDKILGLQDEQNKLTSFVRQYNLTCNDMIKETRQIAAESTASL